jgi:hypothetical protein
MSPNHHLNDQIQLRLISMAKRRLDQLVQWTAGCTFRTVRWSLWECSEYYESLDLLASMVALVLPDLVPVRPLDPQDIVCPLGSSFGTCTLLCTKFCTHWATLLSQ